MRAPLVATVASGYWLTRFRAPSSALDKVALSTAWVTLTRSRGEFHQKPPSMATGSAKYREMARSAATRLETVAWIRMALFVTE